LGEAFETTTPRSSPSLSNNTKTTLKPPKCLPTPLTALCKFPLPLPPQFQLTRSSSDLLRRLNPKNTAHNVSLLCALSPSLSEELLESVDVPLTIKTCSKTKREFLCCDYNRDGDSWRSPWSNEFEPAIDDGVVPSERVRRMEVKANEGFDVYRDL
jgi:hypothetical protein